jgi:Tfp pilus assembly protein PilX
MNKNHHNNQTLIQFILRAQQLARHDARSDRGYAMLITSIISVVLLSLLAAYMTMTNLSKSSTNAYVDGTNSFYAAESGLNKRAQQFREKFANYVNPSGTVPTATGSTAVTAANISNCFSISVNATVSATNDFECRNYPFRYNNNIASVNGAGGGTVLSEGDNNRNTSNYVAHTFVAPKQNYAITPPSVMTIPSGEPYTGLKALEYQYTVYATATKRNETGAIAPNFTTEQKEAKNRVVKEAGDQALITLYDAEQARVDALNNTSAATNSGTNSVLQMNFRSRIVPLFQFAAFYDGDLEMNSASNMTIGGRVHTNANFYIRPFASDATVSTTFLSSITVKGDIYNRVDAFSSTATTSAARVLMLGTSCATVGNCRDFPAFGASTTPPRGATEKLNTLELNAFGSKVKDGDNGIVRLETPPPGFLRKRNYYDSWTGNTVTTTNNSGEYYSKADMRLEMVPDRDADITTAAPWTRNRGIIPFNFTSITRVAGAADTCTTTLPAKDPATGGVPTLANDPAANYIDPERNNPLTTGTLLTNLHCNVFSKGQLQSLRQPVMVLTDSHQTNAGLITATGATPTTTSEAGILGRPATLPALPVIAAATTVATKDAILRALQVAIVSTPAPIELHTLGNTAVSASAFSATFSTLINNAHIPALSDADRITLNAATPNAIAALRNAWFLPAPIQRIEHNQTAVNIPANIRRSGFYDARERRWMTMLQTNIASLSVWNRDGIYVDASAVPTGTTANIDTDVRTVYATNPAMQDAAFNAVFSDAVPGANFGNGLAFDRASTVPTTPKGLQALGLGSVDTTEGGLVLHATVSDDLNGDNVMTAANDVSLDTTNPIKKRNAIGRPVSADNIELPNKPDGSEADGIIIDYPRKYRNGVRSQSPFGFAFNGGDYLPGPLSLVTDQPIYVQGNFNNNGVSQTPDATTGVNIPDPNRLPASLVGDVITVLSNQCLNQDTGNGSTPTATNHLGTPIGQIKCGLPKVNTGSVTISANGFGSNRSYYNVTAPTAVNAAFLSNTDRSNGNLGNGRNDGTGRRFSGGVNNYMRMLEDWGGSTGQFFNYSGSFVSLGTPLESNGTYLGGLPSIGSFGNTSWYNIPQRNFNFDSKFEVFSTLPPLPPRAVYLQQEVFKRSYN